jgi:glycosyltransferase involved in cell wall biosynthesis
MDKITFCIPSKSNLRYLKTCIPSIRENASRNDHEIIIFVDSDEDGTVEWLEQVKDKYNLKYFVNPNLGESLFGIGKAYDYCIEHSTTDIFMIFHADMMLGKDADLKAFNHLKSKTVVCSTRIEPPLHPNGGEKILLDFGMWPEEFKEDKFNQYVEEHSNDDKITNGIFAPWLIHKDDFNNVGGHDPIMKSHSEDRDLFNRFLLNGYKLIQSWEALVYHLTCRGGQFEHASETKDLTHKSNEWNNLAYNQTREFIRKWGTQPKYDEFQHPIIAPKYNIAFVVKSCNSQALESFEPWCDKIYIDDEMGVLFASYYENGYKNTSYDLKKRILNTKYNDPQGENDIIVEFDMKQFTQQSYNIMQQLPEIIKESGEVGSFELNIFKITINNLTEYQNDLIYLKNN